MLPLCAESQSIFHPTYPPETAAKVAKAASDQIVKLGIDCLNDGGVGFSLQREPFIAALEECFWKPDVLSARLTSDEAGSGLVQAMMEVGFFSQRQFGGHTINYQRLLDYRVGSERNGDGWTAGELLPETEVRTAILPSDIFEAGGGLRLDDRSDRVAVKVAVGRLALRKAVSATSGVECS